LLPFLPGICSLREMATITDIIVMPRDYLEKIIRNIPLKESLCTFPYQNCPIELLRMDPHNLQIGQCFVQRNKYTDFLENFSQYFDQFCVTRGSAKCNAMIVRGTDSAGRKVIAHYVPPIIEEHRCGYILLDGIHRNFLVQKIGTTLECILIKDVTTAFPCTPHGWLDIAIVDSKPPLEERYFNLQPSLFRHLYWTGIDG
jgi:hypothetical protein